MAEVPIEHTRADAGQSQHHQCLLPSPDSSQFFSPCPLPWTSGVFELHFPSPNFSDSYIPSAMVSSPALSSSPPPMVWFTLLASLQSGPFQMPLPLLSLISTRNLLSRIPGTSPVLIFHSLRKRDTVADHTGVQNSAFPDCFYQSLNDYQSLKHRFSKNPRGKEATASITKM